MTETRQLVLMVDDDIEALAAWAMLLEFNGYPVVTAASGAQAQTIVRDQPIRIIVTDLMMPGMTGLELCAELKRHDACIREIPVVIYTAAPLDPRLERDRHLYNRVLEKPLSLDTMLRCLSDLTHRN